MGESAVITIRRQVLDVAIRATEAEGLALQRRLPGICADVLLPAIESALAPYDPVDAHLTVDRLEIRVSIASPDRFDADLAEGVRRELAEWFRRHPPVPDAPTRAGTLSDGSAGCLVRARTGAETVDEALAVFLATGRLPWSFDVPAGTSLEQVIMESWAVTGRQAEGRPAPGPATQARLLEMLRDARARARLVLQFSPTFRLAVLGALAPDVAGTTEQVLRTLQELPWPDWPAAHSTGSGAFTGQVWQAGLLAACSGERPGPQQLVANAWARTYASLAPDPVARVLAEALERHWPGVTGEPAAPAPEDRSDLPRPTSSSRRPDLSEESDAGVDNGVLVDSAGLVLLHPFLPRFLDGLGLAHGERLLDPHRAVGVLHHLATGELTVPEHRVTLAKILCGIPLDEPVPWEIGVGDEVASYASEATALLEAVVGHWTALRDTSPDALRGEFLTRPGMVSVTDDGDWLLRVESRTVDILLADLPWGFSMFRLPWMSALMQVEWR